MLNKLRSITLGLSFVVIAGLLALYLYVQMGKAGDIFGDSTGSLEKIDFETVNYPADTEGYLLCPQTLCAQATPDGPAQFFDMSASSLRQKLVDYADMMPMIAPRHIDIRKNQFDFLERMPGQHLPAIVAVRILEDTKYTSKLAIYSYQPIGESTTFDHMERVERWLVHLKKSQ